MYGYQEATFKEMLMYIEGVCRGRTIATHRCATSYRGIGDFPDYVRQRFQRGPKEHWTKILLEELGNLPYFDSLGAIDRLLCDWEASKT